MQPTSQRLSVFLLLILLAVMALTACTDQFNNNMATFNAAATQAAQGFEGVNITLPAVEGLLTPDITNTAQGTLFDVRNNPNAGLATAWGQANGLASGQQFTIYATQAQVGEFVVQTLRLNGWQDTVQGGSAALGMGQVRIDLALQVRNGDNVEGGSGTVTFHPTLDGAGRLRPNPQGATFGSLNVPNNLIGAIQEAVHQALTGAPNDGLTRVNLLVLELHNGELRVTGTLR